MQKHEKDSENSMVTDSSTLSKQAKEKKPLATIFNFLLPFTQFKKKESFLTKPHPPHSHRSFTNLSIYRTLFRRRFDPFTFFPYKEIVLRAIHSFVLAFGVKSGITLLLKWVKLFSLASKLPSFRKAWVQATLQATCYNTDAFRLASFFAFFTTLFHLSLNAFIFYTPQLALRWKGFLAGTIAGIAILIETKPNRISWVQQCSMRAFQAFYNLLKSRYSISFPLGDSLLFIVSSAQIMYAFIRHPTTLPPAFVQFMSQMAHLPFPVLEANQKVLSNQPFVSSSSFQSYLAPFLDLPHVSSQFNPSRSLPTSSSSSSSSFSSVPSIGSTTLFPALPCAFIHPSFASCSLYNVQLFRKVFTKIFPVYFTLHFVPGLLLKTKQIMTTPFAFFFRALRNTVRSGCFLSVYVTLFQTFVCWHRQCVLKGVLSKDHKLYYSLFGFLNALAIFIEAKQRRSELGMYTAPKAIHSFYLLATSKQWIPRPPYADVVLFSLSMGVIMSLYLTDMETVSPMVARVLKRFFF